MRRIDAFIAGANLVSALWNFMNDDMIWSVINVAFFIFFAVNAARSEK